MLINNSILHAEMRPHYEENQPDLKDKLPVFFFSMKGNEMYTLRNYRTTC